MLAPPACSGCGGPSVATPTPPPGWWLPGGAAPIPPTTLLGVMTRTLSQFVSELEVSLGFGLLGIVGSPVNEDLFRCVSAGHTEERGLLASGGGATAAEAAARASETGDVHHFQIKRLAGEKKAIHSSKNI